MFVLICPVQYSGLCGKEGTLAVITRLNRSENVMLQGLPSDRLSQIFFYPSWVTHRQF